MNEWVPKAYIDMEIVPDQVFPLKSKNDPLTRKKIIQCKCGSIMLIVEDDEKDIGKTNNLVVDRRLDADCGWV